MTGTLYTCALLLISAPELNRQGDSLTHLLGPDASTSQYEEISGAGITRFSLSTGPQESIITWTANSVVYTYSLQGEHHLTQGLALLEALNRDGLARYIADRRGESRRFVEFRRVYSLRLETARKK